MQSKNKQKTFYITTPIYYPSGNLHLGHLYSTTVAWVIKNYKTKMGYDTKFLTGSDEHGQKIEKKAAENKMSPQDYVDVQSGKFIDFWKQVNIDYDYFSRTTNVKHKEIIIKVFNKMLEKGYIYKGEYVGLYSINDEEFVLENQATKRGDDFFHPTSGHKLEVIKEESYFFKMSLFAQWLIDYVNENPEFIIPKHIWLELKNNFLDKNLEDLSITRISFDWGIKVPSDAKHVVYVWLDALFNYVTSLGYSLENKDQDFEKYWKNGDEIVHVVGKEITRFHCIYWPIFLKALDIKLPTSILSHGWIITPEGKMSKSKGNVVDPVELIKKYDVEVLKYYLASQISIYNDGIFSEELLLANYNNELVNILGNLITRTVAMIKKFFPNNFVNYTQSSDELDIETEKTILQSFEEYKTFMDKFEINLGLNQAIKLARDLNKYIDLTTPWKLNDDLKRLEKVLNVLLNGIFATLAMLEVVIPKSAEKFKQILNLSHLDFNLISKWDKFDNQKLGNSEIIFARM